VRNKLPGWPERVKLMQENWIGKSEGVRFAFTHNIRDWHGELIGDGKMYVFTTRADTIMGVTFCAIAPEHPLATHAARANQRLAAFIEDCKKGGTTEAELALREKEGVPTGLVVFHPITGEPIDVWVGNYVLMGYGDGAVMGVPGHDERDFAFALKYNLPIMQVVHVDGEHYDYKHWHDWYADKETGVTINSDIFSGFSYQEAVKAVAPLPEQKGLGETEDHVAPARLGREPASATGARRSRSSIATKHGPCRCPRRTCRSSCRRTACRGSGYPLNKREDFLHCKCPVCGKDARRETDTMDTFVDSAWYYMRYCDPKNDIAMVAAGASYWMPMDQYIGGIEHAILHLLYARFWTKVMRDFGLVKVDEPFTKLLTQGMVLNEAFVRVGEKAGKQYYWAHDLDIVRDEHAKVISATAKADGQPVTYEGWTTMSKSKNNGVDPQDLIEKYGADTARLYTMFTAPPEASLEWNDAALEGSFRFLRRVWNFGHKLGRLLHPPARRWASRPRRCAWRFTACSSRWTTTTSACSTTPSSPAR
jgi:leucyl-tRNA synthetase